MLTKNEAVGVTRFEDPTETLWNKSWKNNGINKTKIDDNLSLWIQNNTWDLLPTLNFTGYKVQILTGRSSTKSNVLRHRM